MQEANSGATLGEAQVGVLCFHQEGEGGGSVQNGPSMSPTQELAARVGPVSGGLRRLGTTRLVPLLEGGLWVSRVGLSKAPVLGSGNLPGSGRTTGLKSNFLFGFLFPRSTSRMWNGLNGPTR